MAFSRAEWCDVTISISVFGAKFDDSAFSAVQFTDKMDIIYFYIFTDNGNQGSLYIIYWSIAHK